MAPSGPPAGWYNDPENATQLRWWDGTQWTEHALAAQSSTAKSEATSEATSTEVGESDGRAVQDVTEPGPADEPIAFVDGYGVDVSLFPQILIAEATNFASRGGLGAKQRGIPLDEVTAVTMTKPNLLVNGILTVVTPAGATLMPFTRSQADEMAVLYDRLISAAPQAALGAAAEPIVKSAPMAKGAGRTIEEAAADLVERREAAREMAEAARTFEGFSALEAQKEGLVLAKGERLYGVVEGAQLVEVKHAPGHYQFGGASSRLRITEGVSVGVGGGRGQYVPGPEGPTSVDQGKVAITDRRIVFVGPRQSREWAFAKLTGIAHSPTGTWTALSVSNRKTTSGIGYTDETADTIRFRITLALAEFQGTREELATSLEAEAMGT